MSFLQRRKGRRGTIPAFLRRCKYCKYFELLYCKYHAVSIHPDSRACPAFELAEQFTSQVKESEHGG